jgi:hypothetical protein
VRQFFQLVSKDPTSASTLLDPQLLGTQLSAFVKSWSTTETVIIDELVSADANTVIATLRIKQEDGTWLRLHEQLTLTGAGDSTTRSAITSENTTIPLIADAELLSAQHS